jgi:hypothetical protein
MLSQQQIEFEKKLANKVRKMTDSEIVALYSEAMAWRRTRFEDLRDMSMDIQADMIRETVDDEEEVDEEL